MNTHAARQWAVLLLFVALTFLAALGGALFPPGADYAALRRPSFAPPNWVFGPVWTLLYLLIAVAGWRVWRRVGWRSPALRLWLTQLLLNGLWTPIFFGLGWLGVALLEMALLWIAIALCLAASWRVDRAAGLMLLPYLAWVSFAFVLNAGFWWLNR